MKKLLKKLSLGSGAVLIVATVILSTTNTVEPAEAYYGNWKSESRACKVTTTVLTSSETTTTVFNGTIRICVDGDGWCFWNGSCG